MGVIRRKVGKCLVNQVYQAAQTQNPSIKSIELA